MVAPHVPPTGDLAHNPGLCRDWELNRRPFGLQASPQSTEPHQPGLSIITRKLYICTSRKFSLCMELAASCQGYCAYVWNYTSGRISAMCNHSEEKSCNINKKHGRKNLEYLTWEKFKSLHKLSPIM